MAGWTYSYIVKSSIDLFGLLAAVDVYTLWCVGVTDEHLCGCTGGGGLVQCHCGIYRYRTTNHGRYHTVTYHNGIRCHLSGKSPNNGPFYVSANFHKGHSFCVFHQPANNTTYVCIVVGGHSMLSHCSLFSSDLDQFVEIVWLLLYTLQPCGDDLFTFTRDILSVLPRPLEQCSVFVLCFSRLRKTKRHNNAF